MCHVDDTKCSRNMRDMCHSGSFGINQGLLGQNRVKTGSNVGHVEGSVSHVGPMGLMCFMGYRPVNSFSRSVGFVRFLHHGLTENTELGL